ncbi:hypothetical protein [Shewanella sp. 0m-4]
MNIKASIQDAVLTPFTRSIYQKASLVIGFGLLIWSYFYDALAFSVCFTVLLTLYAIVSFAFKARQRQLIYLKNNVVVVVKSVLMSAFDKWVFGFFIVISIVSNTYALANINFIAIGIIAYQFCILIFIYRLLQRQCEFALPLDSQYLLLENEQSNCLLIKRFDIYFLEQQTEVLPQQAEGIEQAIEYIGSISLEEDDADGVIATLNQHLSMTRGRTVTKKSWRASVKPFLFAIAGIYTYVFLLPGFFKAILPVGPYRNKFRDVINRTESMSDMGVVVMMVITFIMLALPSFVFIFTFYSDIKSRSFKAVCTTRDAVWLLTPGTSSSSSISGHESRTILRSTMSHIACADIQVAAEDNTPLRLSIDGDIKLIGRDDNLISLSSWAWSGRFILNHLVKLGLPVRLVQQANQPKVE